MRNKTGTNLVLERPHQGGPNAKQTSAEPITPDRSLHTDL